MRRLLFSNFLVPNSKSPKSLAEARSLESRGGSEPAAHSFALRPPTWSQGPRPRPRLGPASRLAARPGPCRVKRRNVAARNVHADEPRAGRGGGGAMLIACKCGGPSPPGPPLGGASRIRAQTASAPEPGRRDPRRPQGDGEEEEEEAEAGAAARGRRRRRRFAHRLRRRHGGLTPGRAESRASRGAPPRVAQPRPAAPRRRPRRGRRPGRQPGSRRVARPVPMEAPLAGEAADHA